MATQLPNTNISALTLLQNLIGLLNSNFKATQTALDEKLTAHRVTVDGYAATGATTSTIKLPNKSPQGSTPWAVILVRARASADPGGDLPVSSRLNFTQQGDTLYVYEPAGLTLNTLYTMDFLVLE